MLKKDNFWLGIALGIIIPFVMYAIWQLFFDQFESAGVMSDEDMADNFSERTTALMAIAMNAIPLTLYNKMKFINTMRGVILPTAIYVIAWFIIYGRHLIG